jgi:glutamate/aspartate transport system substrate-binding protein
MKFRLLIGIAAALLIGCATQNDERVVIGVREAAGALSYRTDSGKFAGFHVAICEKIVANYAKATGKPHLRIEYQPVTSASRIDDVVSGRVELECGSTTNNAARQAVVDFLPTSYVMEGRIIAPVSSPILSMADLRGKRIGAISSTMTTDGLKRVLTQHGISAETVSLRPDELVSMLKSGRVDAIAVEADLWAVLDARHSTSEPMSVKYVGPILATEPIGIVLSKRQGKLRDVAYETMASLMKSGEIESIYRSSLQTDVAPPLKKLNLPPNESTMQSWRRPSSQP